MGGDHHLQGACWALTHCLTTSTILCALGVVRPTLQKAQLWFREF